MSHNGLGQSEQQLDNLLHNIQSEELFPLKNGKANELVINFDYLKNTYPNIEVIGLLALVNDGRHPLLLRLKKGKYASYSEDVLSERETEIVELVAYGYSNYEIASHLKIKVNTVKRHLSNIFQKLDIQSRTQAAMYAVLQGIASPWEKTAH
jgi:ATP/maltotriose-dependent transcriptional regulator MalT